MAKGEFVWVIGDDEILKPNTFKILSENFKKNTDIDFMYINSNFLQSEYFSKFKKPFNSYHLPKKMETFSKIKKNKKVMFLILYITKFHGIFYLEYSKVFTKEKCF